MSLKQIIKRSQLGHPGADYTLQMPGEPLIYSIKYTLKNRTHSAQYLRSKQWFSILRSTFPKCFNTSTPVVIVAKFFISPPEDFPKTSNSKLETMPAVEGYELCDYLLCLLENLHHVLINSYRQIVKIDVEKHYSNNPRIELKFMRFHDYQHFYGNNSLNSKAKSVGTSKRMGRQVQSKRKGNERNEAMCDKPDQGQETASNEGSCYGNSSLQTTSTIEVHSQAEKDIKHDSSSKKTRRRQSRKIPQ